jgi:hypothetical protein
MQAGLLGVDVEALRDTGAEVTAAAGVLRDAVTAAGPGLVPDGQPGSAAAVAAQTAEKAWLADLRRFTDQLTAFGASLTQAARDYQATDQAGADQLRRGGYQVPR